MRNLSIGFVLATSACNGGGGGGVSSRASDILSLTGDPTSGETVFADNCASCHAADGTGGAGPNLTQTSFQDEYVDLILNGEDSMPSFSSLSDQEIADMLAWLDENVFL